MDINAMFGMEYNPFRKTRNMKHIETSEFREVQARLRYLQENHGVGRHILLQKKCSLF